MYYGQIFAKHSYSCTWKWALFCNIRSGNLEAVRLQGHMHRIFSRGSSSKKGKTNSKYKNTPVLDNFCKSQKACYRKIQNGQIPRSPNWLISYFFWVKRHLFFSPACRGKTVGADMNAFEICLDCQKQNWTNFAVAVEKTWWECRVLAESLGLEPVKTKHSLCTRIFPGPGVEFRHILCSLTLLYG